RVATRIVFDRKASLSSGSQLVQTTGDAPVLVVAAADAPAENVARLQSAGCEIWKHSATAGDDSTHAEAVGQLLDELGRRRMTNILVEGGGQLLGALLDA